MTAVPSIKAIILTAQPQFLVTVFSKSVSYVSFYTDGPVRIVSRPKCCIATIRFFSKRKVRLGQ